MEHRWGCRVSTGIDVQLFGLPATIGWGRLRDASVSGGFIETALTLRTLSVMRVTFPGGGHGKYTAPFVDAIVVRRTPEGLGVEWLDGASQVIASIVRDELVIGPAARAADPIRTYLASRASAGRTPD
jgi:hypothetical protein